MRLNVMLILMSVSVAFGACTNEGVDNLKLENRDDSLSYAFGVDLYNNLKTRSDIELDPMYMAKGMKEAKEGEAIFADAAASGYIMMVMEEREKEKMAEQFKDYKIENEEFLEANKEEEGVITTPSGLQYKVLEMGEGERPELTDTVEVHYTGKLIDGTVFDSSIERGEPAQFRVNALIKGWSEGLQLMPEGSKYMFYVPYDLGYGEGGAGQTIKPFSTLVFEVHLLDIINGQ